MNLKTLGAGCAALALLCLPASHGGAEAPAAGSGSARIVADYAASLAGIKLGDFKVVAAFKGAEYDINANGEFSFLGGLVYKGGGGVTSHGVLADTNPEPVRFTLSYADNKKNEKRTIVFRRGAVKKVSMFPKKRPHPQAVPITEEHLEDVLDPLTAAFLPVRTSAPPDSPKVCQQTLRVFEGRQRFDLVLSPKRTETLPSGAANGLTGRAAVCDARYVPVSGHKPDHPGVQFLQKADGMEVWLVRAPDTDFYVPFKIAVPTALGSGGIQLTGLAVNVGAPKALPAP